MPSERGGGEETGQRLLYMTLKAAETYCFLLLTLIMKCLVGPIFVSKLRSIRLTRLIFNGNRLIVQQICTFWQGIKRQGLSDSFSVCIQKQSLVHEETPTFIYNTK